MYKRPLLRELWEELDSVVYRLMTDGWDKGPLSAEDHKAWGIDIGQAQGLTYAIALTYDMLEPNVEWVRAEAMRRWEQHVESPTPIGRRLSGQVVRNDFRVLGIRRGHPDRPVLGARLGGGRGVARLPLGRVRRIAGR